MDASISGGILGDHPRRSHSSNQRQKIELAATWSCYNSKVSGWLWECPSDLRKYCDGQKLIFLGQRVQFKQINEAHYIPSGMYYRLMWYLTAPATSCAQLSDHWLPSDLLLSVSPCRAGRVMNDQHGCRYDSKIPSNQALTIYIDWGPYSKGSGVDKADKDCSHQLLCLAEF